MTNDVYVTDELFIDKVGYKVDTILSENNSIINLIYGVSKVPYKVNKDTLNFLELYGIEKGVLINSNNEELVDFRQNLKSKRTKKDTRELKSLSSSVTLQTNILNIANTYSSVEKLYFPVRLDQRTRLYCTPEYFNYQSTDLAKGLLLFAEPGTIHKHDTEAINYFKSFGAILFDSSLSKKSLTSRVK